jgi:hypothetical protein
LTTQNQKLLERTTTTRARFKKKKLL